MPDQVINLLDKKKRGNHHWWPKSIQRHWINSDGQIHQRTGDAVEPKNPENDRTGCSRNQHYFDVGDSPWSHSFECAFQAVDTEGAEVVRLCMRRVKETPSYRISRAKFLSWPPLNSVATHTKYDCLDSEDTRRLARLALSVAIRSPAFQFKKSLPHTSFFPSDAPNKSLGTANIWHYWADLYAEPLLPYNPMSVIFLISANGSEFVFGDGLFENVIDRKRLTPSKGGGWRALYSGGIMFPLSPDICCVIHFNSRRGQRLAILSTEETEEVNTITCLSSRDKIYFRTHDQPKFKPQHSPDIRKVSLDPSSFLRPWFETAPSP